MLEAAPATVNDAGSAVALALLSLVCAKQACRTFLSRGLFAKMSSVSLHFLPFIYLFEFVYLFQ